MWHAVAPVTPDYDPIVYEGGTTGVVLVLNTGPNEVQLKGWTVDTLKEPNLLLTLRAGDMRIIAATLIRLSLKDATRGNSAVAWRFLQNGER